MDDPSKILDHTLKKLFDKAFEDNLIDDKEFELIQRIEISVEEYVEGLNKALLDKVITSEESDKLEELKQKIVDEAESFASSDGEIDAEEAELLKTLGSILKRYRTD